MKNLKKMFAVVIAMVMALAMGISVFAANEINGADYDTAYFTVGAKKVDLIGHTFNAVQIIKAAEYDKTKTPPYTGISWGAQITDNGAALLTALQADTTLQNDFVNFVTDPAQVTDQKPLFTAAAFANVVQNFNADKLEALISVVKGLNLSGQTITVTEGMDPVELTGGIGLYMIDDTTAAASLEDDVANASILTAVPGSNTIRIKVDKPSQDKEVKENVKGEPAWNEVSDYNILDAVPYRIMSKIPNPEKFTNYTMTFSDTMSSGLTLYDKWEGDTPTNLTPANIKVTVGNTDVTDKATITKNAQGFDLTLPIKKEGTLATWATPEAEILIEFYGVLNTDAVIGLDGNTNKSKLIYSNNPDDDDSVTETPWDTVITFTYELDVNKIDGATEDALPGAQFALKATTGEHANKYVVVNSDGKVIGWQDTAPQADAPAGSDGSTALLVSKANGLFNVTGLDDGTYSLIEIKEPAGYNKIDPITLVIKATTTNNYDYTDELHDTASEALTKLEITANGKTSDGDTTTGIVSTTVENNSGSILPETGGMGTTIFYILGTILVLSAGVLLITRRRMKAK